MLLCLLLYTIRVTSFSDNYIVRWENSIAIAIRELGLGLELELGLGLGIEGPWETASRSLTRFAVGVLEAEHRDDANT